MVKVTSQTQRQRRINEVIRQHLSQLFIQSDLHLSTLVLTSFISINEVRVSRDLRHATVFAFPFAIEDELEQKQIIDTINSNIYELNKAVASIMNTRISPRLNFRLDPVPSQTKKLQSLLDNPHVKQDIVDDSQDIIGDSEE